MPDIMDIFPDRVIPEPNSGCWLWEGAAQDGGYGSFRKDSKSISAHRFSLEISNGKLEKGMMALHTCDTKLCVNPSHLYAGSRSQNSLDAYRRGRMTNVRPPSGEHHPMARLTRKQVAEIRSVKGRFRRGQREEMARRFGVSPATISDVKGGHSWRHECF